MVKLLVIQNPVAGTKPAEFVSNKITNFFDRTAWEYQIHQTKRGEDIPSLVNSYIQKGFDLFVAAGGDGTISAVASGLAKDNIPIGVLPVGTGNGLARDLKIPMNIDEALELIYSRPSILYLDGMQVRERYYLLNLSVGLTPMALDITNREQKRKLGRLAYLFAGFRSLVGIQPINYSLTIDGRKVQISASEILVMNSVTLGDPGRYLNLGIENDDGILDLFVIQSKTILDYFRVFMNLILQKTHQDPDVQRFSVEKSLVIRGGRFLQVQADGEMIGYTPVELNLIPGAVAIIVPK